MTRRSLLDDDLEKPPAGGDLIAQMQCVMRGALGKGWDARAFGCFKYAWGSTPEESMLAAVALRDPKPETSKRRKVIM